MPIEILLPGSHAECLRSNLRPFGQKVKCSDYEVTNKLSARGYEGRIVGYTNTFQTYWVIDPSGKTRLAKNPQPVQSVPDSDDETLILTNDKMLPKESEDTMPELPTQDLDTPSLTPSEESEPGPSEEQRIEPSVPKRKKGKDWTSVVGTRDQPTRESKKRVLAIGIDPDHPTDEQARNSPQAAKWAKAREKERDQLMKYGVFTKIKKSDIPESTKIVDTKWVYVIKRKADGTIDKYKARKVGRGFTQEAGISYDTDKTYAQIMRPETLKILLVIALYRKWAICQWDIIAAYLQALLHHDVYVSDINEQGEIEYWKLNKALYGLKQAGYEWFKTLQEILHFTGLEQCIRDEGSYASTDGQLIIGSHVDDLLGIAPTEADLDKAEKSVEKSVELDKRGRPSLILGIELSWNKENTEVILTQ